MTKQDDLNRHLNPLQMRSAAYGGQEYFFDQQDRNYLAAMRYGGAWDVAKVPYLYNQVVTHNGFPWVAVVDTSAEPGQGGTDWLPLAGLNGRGAMDMGGTNVSAPDLGAGWNALTQFDTVRVAPVGCAFTLASGQFQFLYPGFWKLSMYFTFEHNSSNQGRNTNLRVWDVTGGAVQAGPTILATGRNQEATTASFSFMLDVTPAMLPNTFQIEVGGGSAYTSVVYDALSLDLAQVAVT